jgi:putative tricarboxylic transport membrane protein
MASKTKKEVRMKRSIALRILAITLMVVGFSPFVLAAPYPEKPIEFIVHTPAGGGADIFARRISDMLAKEKLVSAPFVIVNKGGGSGAIATAFVANREGNPYTIFGVTTAIYTNLLKGDLKLTLNNFTPICALIQDPNMLAVNADSPYKNVKEFIAAAKKERKGMKQGLGSLGASDHITATRIARAAGVEFNTIAFKQGSEAVTALLGGHIDFIVGNPSENAGQIEAGKLRALAVCTEKRLPEMPNVPTIKEAGVDMYFSQIRGIWGPKNMPPDVVKYWEAVFSKLVKTESWKKYLKDEAVLDAYMGSGDYKKWLVKELPVFEQDLREMNLIKK